MGLDTMMRQATAGRDDWANANSPSPTTSTQGGTPVMISTDISSNDYRDLWARVRARLKAAVGEDVFTSWFARLELEEIVDDLVHLSAPTRFLCSWVQSNYADRIVEAFRNDIAEAARLQVTMRVNGQARPRLAPVAEIAPETPAEPTAAALATTPAPAAPRLVRDAIKGGDALNGSAIDPRMTFDTWLKFPARRTGTAPNPTPVKSVDRWFWRVVPPLFFPAGQCTLEARNWTRNT